MFYKAILIAFIGVSLFTKRAILESQEDPGEEPSPVDEGDVSGDAPREPFDSNNPPPDDAAPSPPEEYSDHENAVVEEDMSDDYDAQPYVYYSIDAPGYQYPDQPDENPEPEIVQEEPENGKEGEIKEQGNDIEEPESDNGEPEPVKAEAGEAIEVASDEELRADEEVDNSEQPDNNEELSDPNIDNENEQDELSNDDGFGPNDDDTSGDEVKVDDNGDPISDKSEGTDTDSAVQPNNAEITPILTCPEGWIFYEQSSTCYHVTFNSQNWEDSRALCREIGGSLASFHSAEEAHFVEGLLSGNAWIGLNDVAEKKAYKWSDLSPLDYNNWAEGEPSFCYRVPFFGCLAREQCVEMKKAKSYKWNDDGCSTDKKAVCARQPELIPRTACPEGWLADEGTATCYRLSTVKVDHVGAVQMCSSMAVGASLVAPADEAQNTFLTNVLNEKKVKSIWLGINDREREDEFSTVEGAAQEYFNWDQEQPSEFLFFNEDCVLMIKNGKWNDEECYHKYNFICSLKLN